MLTSHQFPQEDEDGLHNLRSGQHLVHMHMHAAMETPVGKVGTTRTGRLDSETSRSCTVSNMERLTCKSRGTASEKASGIADRVRMAQARTTGKASKLKI